MLKSLAQLLVALIPGTEPAPTDQAFDIATLTCHQFVIASDRSRMTAIEEITEQLSQLSDGKKLGQAGIKDLFFRLDLACLDAPQALVLHVVSAWRRPLGNAGRG